MPPPPLLTCSFPNIFFCQKSPKIADKTIFRSFSSLLPFSPPPKRQNFCSHPQKKYSGSKFGRRLRRLIYFCCFTEKLSLFAEGCKTFSSLISFCFCERSKWKRKRKEIPQNNRKNEKFEVEMKFFWVNFIFWKKIKNKK